MKFMNNTLGNTDIVITWVDGSDTEWQSVRAKYKYAETGKVSEARFRDPGTLKYVFRSIDRYAPWVRKIHFITCGQVPTWLNINHPKINFVKHSDYIPEQFLPTFSSHTIELNFHRIHELTEQFIYFNDDMLLAAPVRETDFFVDGKPCDTAILEPTIGTVPGNAFVHYLVNNIALINRHFKLDKVQKGNIHKWFNLKYGKYILNNLIFSLRYSIFVGFHNFHMPVPHLKSTFQKVWELEPDLCFKTCENKFRGLNDISPYVMNYYNFCTNQFVPQSPRYGKYVELGCDRPTLQDALSGKYKRVAINDVDSVQNYVESCKLLKEVLEEKFPVKCSFEL